MLFEDAIKHSKNQQNIETDRVVGADSAYALPVKTVTNKALSNLFVDICFVQFQ